MIHRKPIRRRDNVIERMELEIDTAGSHLQIPVPTTNHRPNSYPDEKAAPHRYIDTVPRLVRPR